MEAGRAARLGEKKLDVEDVRQLYERHGPALMVYACGYAVDRASAEDIVHTLFQRLLRGDIAVPEQAAGYLYRAVRNAALNARLDCRRPPRSPASPCISLADEFCRNVLATPSAHEWARTDRPEEIGRSVRIRAS
jgi:DNA-directed RNA polymerase specialized sigma24 family protein